METISVIRILDDIKRFFPGVVHRITTAIIYVLFLGLFTHFAEKPEDVGSPGWLARQGEITPPGQYG